MIAIIRTLALAFLMAALISLHPQSGQAWNWTTGLGGGPSKWNSMPKTVYADNTTMTTAMIWIAGDSCFDWEDAWPTGYDISAYYSTSNGSGPSNDGYNKAYYHDITDDCGGCLAWTLLRYASGSSNTVVEADIEFNSDTDVVSWYVGTGTCPSNKMDFWTVALHEYGHMALCAHSSYSTAIMNPSTSTGGMRRTFTWDDIGCLTYGDSIGAY